MKFAQIPDRTAAERFTRTRCCTAIRIDDPDALWVHELIGRRGRRGRRYRARPCVSVIENPAADLLELDSGALVPSNFVVSNADGVVVVDPPEGLFDLDGS